VSAVGSFLAVLSPGFPRCGILLPDRDFAFLRNHRAPVPLLAFVAWIRRALKRFFVDQIFKSFLLARVWLRRARFGCLPRSIVFSALIQVLPCGALSALGGGFVVGCCVVFGPVRFRFGLVPENRLVCRSLGRHPRRFGPDVGKPCPDLVRFVQHRNVFVAQRPAGVIRSRRLVWHQGRTFIPV